MCSPCPTRISAGVKDCKAGSNKTSAGTDTDTTSATHISWPPSPEQADQIGAPEDIDGGGTGTGSDSDSDNSTGDPCEDGWNVDDDDGTPDKERPVWVYVNHSPRCCDSGAEGVDVAVLAEGASTLTVRNFLCIHAPTTSLSSCGS